MHYVLSNAKKLYDGSSSQKSSVHSGVDIEVKNGLIASIAPHTPAPSDTVIPFVDCSDKVVTPGLIDCHSHVTVLGIKAEQAHRMNSGMQWLLYLEKILVTTLVDGGTTTIRDVGGATHFMKRMVDEGQMIGPRMKISICMLSTTSGHADFRGPDRCHAEISKLWPEGPGRPSSIVDGPWECRKRVREIAGCGADLIKLCTSPGIASPSDKLENRDFSPEEIFAICDEAAHRGLRVAAHAHSKSGIEMAIDNGVHDIQHISFLDERLTEKAYEKGCTVTPTSWVTSELLGDYGFSNAVKEKVAQVQETHSTAVRYAKKGGLKILSGTDPVLPGMHGKNYLEMVALIKDGLTNLEAWHSNTGEAAIEIEQTDAGQIKAGYRADLLVCDKDVVEDPSLFSEGALVEVIKDGAGYRNTLSDIPQRDFHTLVNEKLDPSAI